MRYLLRKTDVIAYFDHNMAAVGRAFEPITGKALTKGAVRLWPDLVPELRARQLLEQYPALQEFVLDPVTLLTAQEMREQLATGMGL
jgi:hypothetical protein